MKNIEAVIFDWAGTTIDYGCFAPVQAFMEVFRQYGIDVTMDEVRTPMGMLKRDHIKTMLAMPRIHDLWVETYGKSPEEADIDALYSIYEEKQMSILDRFADIKPGVLETVAALREMGIKIGSTTGFTDEMMAVVVPKAAENGYAPDAWFTPNAVGNAGRPYPYMIYRNMEVLGVHSADQVVKVGDTISDIKEGKNAGVFTIGVVEGSSEMGVTKEEYDAMDAQEKAERTEKVKQSFLNAGADAVIMNMGELLDVLKQ